MTIDNKCSIPQKKFAAYLKAKFPNINQDETLSVTSDIKRLVRVISRMDNELQYVLSYKKSKHGTEGEIDRIIRTSPEELLKFVDDKTKKHSLIEVLRAFTNKVVEKENDKRRRKM